MNSIPSAEQTVKKTLECAESFLKQHSNDRGIQATYTYFTHHPVAPLNKKRLKLMLRVLQGRSEELKRPLRVLDLACGGGLITSAISSQGHRALGVDVSEEEIRLAKLFAQEQKQNAVFLRIDLLNDPTWERTAEEILGGRPDVITLAYALHHLPQVENFVERLGRWLDTGAILLVNEENPESPLFRLKHRVRTWIQKDTETEWHRTYPAWKQLLELHGFRLSDPLIGTDIIPALGKFKPELCWSLVFIARRC